VIQIWLRSSVLTPDSMIVSEIISETRLSRKGVVTIAVMLEGGGLELPGVADKAVTMLKDGILELESTVIVEDRLDAILGGGEVLELEVTVTLGTGIVPWAGGTIVVFRAGHDPASRRTGQRYSRESIPFQATAG